MRADGVGILDFLMVAIVSAVWKDWGLDKAGVWHDDVF